MIEFRDPALERLWRAAHARRERRGATGSAQVVIADLTPDEALALDGLPWPGRPRTILAGTTFTTTLTRLEAVVRAAGRDLDAVLTEAVGRPPRDLPAESRAQRARRTRWRAWLQEHPTVRAHTGLNEWAAYVVGVGALGPADQDLVETALQVMRALPRSRPVARSTLSAELLDADPHRLDSDTALCKLSTSMLARRRGDAGPPTDSIETRELWLAFGVEVDPLSCTVLTLGLNPQGDAPLARGLRAMLGQGVVLTYGQLRAQPLTHRHEIVFTCENPVVVRAAETSLGATCPPLVCTGGWPNAAVLTLLREVCRPGAVVLHHGDEDAAGFAILAYLADRVAARPWQPVSLVDNDGSDARGRDAARPEELVISALLADLAACSNGCRAAGHR